MLKTLKKSFNKFDVPVILAAVFLFGSFDYENLSVFDKIYMASFAFWSVMKFIRVYTVFKKTGR